MEDDIKEIKEKMLIAAKQLDVLTEDVGKKFALVSEKLNTLAGVRSSTPPNNLNLNPSPRKLPLPRNNRPRSNNM